MLTAINPNTTFGANYKCTIPGQRLDDFLDVLGSICETNGRVYRGFANRGITSTRRIRTDAARKKNYTTRSLSVSSLNNNDVVITHIQPVKGEPSMKKLHIVDGCEKISKDLKNALEEAAARISTM